MAVYEINGQRYNVPDEVQGRQLQDTLMYLSEQGSKGSDQQTQQQQQTYQYGKVKDNIDPSTLSNDKDWLTASKTLYKMNEGKDWSGNPKDLAEYGLDVMGWFNYNLPAMAVNAAEINKASQPQKEAFLYLMDSYDNMNMSWGGVGRFFKGVLADPTTYVGLGTLGIGTAAAQGGKAATKQGLRALLKQSLKAGVVGSVEGGLYGGTDNVIRQSVEVSAGRKENIDAGQVAKSVGTGAALGMVGATAIDAVANRVKRLFTNDRVVNDLPNPEAKPQAKPQDKPQPDVKAQETPQPQQEQGASSFGADVSTNTTKATEDNTPNPPAVADLTAKQPDGIFEYVKLEDMHLPKAETSIPYKSQVMKDNVSKALNLAEQLKGLDHVQIDDVAQQLKTKEMTLAEFEQFSLSTKLARDMTAKELARTTSALSHATDPAQIERLSSKEAQLQPLYSKLQSMDEALGSHSGYLLRQRQEGLQLKGTPKDNPEEFARQVFKAEESANIKEIKSKYDEQISQAIATGDIGEAGRLTTLRNIEVDANLEKQLGKDPGFINKLNEFVISNVFSPTTVMINLVPSGLKLLTRPAVDALFSNPLEAATRKTMTSTYGAMASSIKTASKAALAAFRYEQAILTRESGRLLEGELAIKGQKGAIIRFLPRILNASDEFMSQMTYQGFIAGRVANDAYEAGLKAGLKGKALDKHVKEKVSEAVKGAYSDVSHEESIRTVANKGVNLGYKGERLAEYVKTELNKHPLALRHGNDKEAINYVRDVLYKRPFSGDSKVAGMNVSKAAKSYEQLVHDIPALRLIGQLFFRTPVRVFEEGIRMTPGVQILAPNFLKDLVGKNGRRAQLRAQGESMLSLAITGNVLMLYAQGKITGDGAYANWKQQRNRTDSDKTEPYTITFDDGSTWSFKNFDPIATPVKIIVNALERYDNLATRQRQGEFIDKNLMDKALAAVSVGTGAITQAIRDANLMAGLDGAIQLAQNLSDPEAKEGAMLKFIGSKLRTLVPNTMQKIAKSNDPTLDDPATFWQMIESKLLKGATLGAYNSSASHSYDVLGDVRRINDVGALWNIFSTSTLEERKKGLSATEVEVLRKLDDLSKQTGVTFQVPNTHRMMGKIDLRTQMTSDGKETLYDRWNRYYRDLHPADVLAPILDSGAPIGTHQVSGATVSLVQSTINKLRDAAFYRLMSEESGVTESVINNLVRRSEIQSGLWDQQQ